MSQHNTLFAHLITEAIHATASTIAGLLGPSSGDALSYETILLSADGQLPVTHRLVMGSCTATWAASASYLQGNPGPLAIQTGLSVVDCQEFCEKSVLYVDIISDNILSLENVLTTNGLVRIE